MRSFSLEPVRWLLHPIALVAFAAAAQAWINGADTRAIIAAGLGVLIAAATEAARQRVSPAPVTGRGWKNQGGYALIELLIAVLVILILVFVLLRVA